MCARLPAIMDGGRMEGISHPVPCQPSQLLTGICVCRALANEGHSIYLGFAVPDLDVRESVRNVGGCTEDG